MTELVNFPGFGKWVHTAGNNTYVRKRRADGVYVEILPYNMPSTPQLYCVFLDKSPRFNSCGAGSHILARFNRLEPLIAQCVAEELLKGNMPESIDVAE